MADSNALTWIIDTMKKNAPVLQFDPAEEFFTYNVPGYLERVHYG